MFFIKFHSLKEDFDYNLWLNEARKNAKNDYKNAKTNYEKIVLARFILQMENNKLNDIIWHYITENYHIETDSVYCLDSEKYPSIPNYVVKVCDEIINRL